MVQYEVDLLYIGQLQIMMLHMYIEFIVLLTANISLMYILENDSSIKHTVTLYVL